MNYDNIIQQAKEYQLRLIKEHKSDPYDLVSHLAEAEKWAYKLFELYPEADKNTILLAVWLHDTGHYVGDKDIDHAIKSEELARKFLLHKVSTTLADKVCRAVRAHRCKDLQPETIEEKIIACIDSASHMTDSMYINIMKQGRINYCEGKLERDYRDIALIPQVHNELTAMYNIWKKLIGEYKKLHIVEDDKN